MTRIPALKREEMNEAQLEIFDDIEKRGGRLGGPYTAYIHIPRFMKLNQEMGDYLRDNSLTSDEMQLIVLLTVRHWGAKFAWAVNARGSLDQGFSRELIDDINAKKEPKFDSADNQAIYDVVTKLLSSTQLSDAGYDAAIKQLGQERLTDVVATTGFFGMVSLTLNTFDVTPPPDAPVQLAD